MGYLSRVSGRIVFSPAITYAEVKDSGFVINEPNQNYVDKDVQLESFGDVAYPEDEIDSILPSTDDPYKAYTLIEDLQALVDLLGPKRQYTGFLHIIGEGHDSNVPDIWRLRVKDGKVEVIEPQLVWPD